MNYTVKIIDTQDSTHITKVERAKGSSVVLEWMGGDKKDELFIVGSRLSLTMVGMSQEDGQYLDLFTGDETRYRTIIEDDNLNLVWQGFLLPETYKEPYSNSPILVDFEATDGLGRLKGKYLPDAFYEDEQSVIQIITECLKLTGLNLSFRFAPAIENSDQKDYDKIYIDTSLFKEGGKKNDAYKILDDLLKSMLCTLYQADNYFNVEGFNVRNFRVYTTNIYSPSGMLTDTIEITRERKFVQGTGIPDITMQPPYGIVEITHDRENIKLPESLSKEENEGWVAIRNNEGEIYSTDWFGYNGFYPKADKESGYKVYFEKGDLTNQYFSLRNRPYLRKNKKYKLDINFDIPHDYDSADIDSYVSNGFWTNPFNIEISLLTEDLYGVQQTEILFANTGVDTNGNRYIPQSFGRDQQMETYVEFVANKSGVFDIKISPVKQENNGIERIEIAKVELEQIDFKDTYIANKELTDEYTITKEVDLKFSDDYTALSESFRLQKLRNKVNFNVIEVPVLDTRYWKGYYYKTVPLWGANLIKENIQDVYDAGQPVKIVEVIYNYNNSEEHVVKLEESTFFNVFNVEINDLNAVTEDRTYWERWGDAIYKVEMLRYPDIVANIYNRIYDAPIPQIQNLKVKNNIKFNDFIDFPYLNKDGWMLTNCSWNIDKGFSEINATQAYYNSVNLGSAPGENLPPVVEAGDTIYFEGTTANLISNAYDPDGFIVSYQWTELTSTGAIIGSPNAKNSGLTNLTGDYYQFQIEVTDNDGATATDTVEAFRLEPHALSFTENEVTFNREWHYTLNLDPNISEGAAVNVQGKLFVLSDIGNNLNNGGAALRISRNGQYFRNYELGPDFEGTYSRVSISEPFSINYVKGDILKFELYAAAQVGDPNPDQAEAIARFTIDSLEFVQGVGTFTGVPVSTEKNKTTFS